MLVLGGNPAFDAPPELDLAEKISRIKRAVHFGVWRNETTAACGWHANLANPLESWGDGLAHDGTWTIAQPLFQPIFGGQSALAVVAQMAGHGHDHEGDHVEGSHADGHHEDLGLSLVRATAEAAVGGDFAAVWKKAVHDGFVADTAAKPVDARAEIGDVAADDSWKSADGMEVVFQVSSNVYDGRFANNGWLQETADFVTKLTWDNAACLNPKTAQQLGVKQDSRVTVSVDGNSIDLPVHIVPGHADGTIAVAIGYGRTRAGRVGGDSTTGVPAVGVDVNPIRSKAQWWFAPADVSRASGTYKLASTQQHFGFDDLGQEEINTRVNTDTGTLIREGTFQSYMDFLSGAEGGHGDHDESHDQGDGHEHDGDDSDASDHDEHDGEGHDQGGHGHHHQWPSHHHLHFENFDVTPPSYEWTEKNRWGMAIDLNKCTGCNACVTACQAENNIPIVGKDQVMRGREMHWMRIDRYFATAEGDALAEDATLVHQPVTCQQCEKAPCETVCPVAATTHSREGLNDMVYNRCIGTRYCGNNCPYKVRRFNYLNYSDAQTFVKYPGADTLSKADRALKNLVMNPEVTVRSRGVMEKCTFCVQRIQNTKIKARNEKREIGPNEIQTACQVACPSEAIVFGDLNNKESMVAQAHANPRAYTLLEDMNNFPRNRYLARVRNPHPSLDHSAEGSGSGGEAH